MFIVRETLFKALRRLLMAGLSAGIALAAWSQAAVAERRIALVIGNAAYSHVPMLRNPVQDATRVTSLLRQLDFDVTTLTDADKIGMEEAIRHFTASVEGADVALFYYSGHALQVADRNYIVPTSAEISGPRNLNLDTFALQDISAAMRQAGAKIQLLFLDACRDNPFGEALGTSQGFSSTRGLARIETPTGSLVVFSTSPGQVALDGTGALSPFTSAFSHYAVQPKLEIRQVLSRVRAEVSEVTDNRQVPWDDSSLASDFYLVPPRAPPVYDHSMRVSLSADPKAQPLNLVAPVQREGGALTITIDQAPTAGQLKIASRSVAANDALTPSEFKDLAYEGSSAAAADSFTFKVDDAWGNSDVGVVAIVRNLAEAANTAPPPAPAPTASVDVHADAVSLLGLGPNLVFKSPMATAKAQGEGLIQLASNLPFGQMVLGDRVIEQGRTVDASEVRRLAFIPPVGSAGKHIEAVFKAVEHPADEVRVDIDVEMTDCDRLAGDRLDAQGVGEGILSGQIDTNAALPACETAVKARPTLGRFNYELGRVYGALGRNDEALALFRKAAGLGHTRAIWAIGNHDEYSQPPDFVQGKIALERAAAAGDVFAIHTLGLVYYEGRGVPRDWNKARSLFEAAARVGHTYSMNSLGGMYQRGEGEPVDPAMARRYWEESAARGDIYGIDNLGFAYLEGVGVEKDSAKALDYFKRASDLGHPEAPNNIGRMYVLGLGVPVNYEEARKWDLIGADRGDAWASFNLGELHRLGHGGAPDPAEAGYFYARAAASTNQLEPNALARKQLVALDHTTKVGALRHLLADIDPGKAQAAEPELMTAAQGAVAQKHIKLAGKSLDALVIATAQAVWVERNARTDLF